MSRVVAPSAIRVPISLGYERVAHMERELLADTGGGRLLPYMSLHEFEAIVWVSPTTVAADRSADLASSCWQVSGAAACWHTRPDLAFVEAYNPKEGSLFGGQRGRRTMQLTSGAARMDAARS